MTILVYYSSPCVIRLCVSKGIQKTTTAFLLKQTKDNQKKGQALQLYLLRNDLVIGQSILPVHSWSTRSTFVLFRLIDVDYSPENISISLSFRKHHQGKTYHAA